MPRHFVDLDGANALPTGHFQMTTRIVRDLVATPPPASSTARPAPARPSPSKPPSKPPSTRSTQSSGRRCAS